MADDWFIYKTSKDSSEAAKSMQQLNGVSKWCHDTGSLISPDKAQTLWCKLDNRAASKQMPAVTFDGAVVERTSSEIPLDPLWQNTDPQKTRGNNSNEVQERSDSPEGYILYGFKGYWTTPLLPTVSKCGAQCHWLGIRPHNNGTDKSANVGQSAERGNASHTRNHQGLNYWDHEVHARPPTNANHIESGAGQSILQCRRKFPQPTPRSRERHKGMLTGTGQVLDGWSRGLNTAGMPADRTQANKGV